MPLQIIHMAVQISPNSLPMRFAHYTYLPDHLSLDNMDDRKETKLRKSWFNSRMQHRSKSVLEVCLGSTDQWAVKKVNSG